MEAGQHQAQETASRQLNASHDTEGARHSPGLFYALNGRQRFSQTAIEYRESETALTL